MNMSVNMSSVGDLRSDDMKKWPPQPELSQVTHFQTESFSKASSYLHLSSMILILRKTKWQVVSQRQRVDNGVRQIPKIRRSVANT